MDNDLMSEFLAESKDLLEQTDQKLVALEKASGDANLLNAVFRGYHTIKGGAGFLDLHGLVRLCHALETLFDALRSGHITMSSSIMDASLEASNDIRRCLNQLSVNPEAAFKPEDSLIALLEAFARGEAPAAAKAAPAAPALSSGASSSAAGDQERLSEQDWRELHTAISPAGSLAPSADSDSSELSVEREADARQERRPAVSEAPKAEKESQIKVDTYRLDAVLTLASEVGLAKNRVGSAKSRILARDFSDEALADLERAVNDLDRLTSSLQNAVMLTRMQPIGRLFSRYPRIVRDLARSLGKKIEIELSGHETEIDKGMIEDLADPLVHLIRNSADHGIEAPERRLAAGKREDGLIRLSAQQEGDRILLEIQDDGKGIDPAFIRSKAKSKGLMDPAAIDALTDRQALELIFLPGFSTAEAISNVSGRGVGMDVVKTNILKMGGEVSIDSTPGNGSTIQIRLPLTLAVLPALLLRCSGQGLALPLSSVQEILSLAEHKPQMAGGRPVISLRGEIIRVLDLSDLLGWGKTIDAPVAALVDLGNDRKVALTADGFIGREEVMVKPLEGVKPKGVSGVMVDAKGDIVLILDLKELLGPVLDVAS